MQSMKTRLTDDLLDQCNDNETSQMEHFHCTTNVLRGFHRYTCMCKDIKALESDIVFDVDSNSGRKIVNTVSDVFAPSDDHHGLREIWEAHCAATRTSC